MSNARNRSRGILTPTKLTVPTAASDPSGASAGDVYYNTAQGRVRIYDGSAWGNIYTPPPANLLTPDYSLSWSSSTSTAAAGNPAYLADAYDLLSTSGWESHGYQHSAGSADMWIQVDLGSSKTLTASAAIGYPNGSHWCDNNYIQGSNDNSTWTTLATWGQHPGNTSSAGYLFYQDSSNHKYSTVLANIDTYKVTLPGTSWRYVRIGGTGWNISNGYQLLVNWILMGY